VLDQFGIERCPVVGHLAGSVYAFAAAGRLGSRINHIVSISGGVPILSIDHFADIAPRQRTFSYTARFAPQLLPMLVRTGVALIDRGGFRNIVEAMHHASPIDLATASNPEIFELISQGYRFTVSQGHSAFVIDAHHVVRDWSEYVDGCDQPVTLLHGAHDPVVPIKAVRNFATRLGARAQLVELSEHGQLLLHSAPASVLELFERLLNTVDA
jgi:pimeloyl-ACP methyl ester carboxylesterase